MSLGQLVHITDELWAEAILASFHEARERETEEASAYGDDSDGDHDESKCFRHARLAQGGRARRSKRKERVEARVEVAAAEAGGEGIEK